MFEEESVSPHPLLDSGAPLAARMRPRTLQEFAGQQGVVGEGTLLRRAIERDTLTSALFWGPPGCGKTTLAQIIAQTTKSNFENFSAITSGVADLRKVIETAKERKRKLAQKTVLFVDEIHRWNKSQQDALLPHVEDGTVVLIGATTENPYFEINAPLLSRSRLFRFEKLTEEAILRLLERALEDNERGLGNLNIEADENALLHLADISDGDARRALTALEAAALSLPLPASETEKRHLTLALAEEGAQARQLGYDREGDEHYDTISAFIKSVRGSDPDAALYWLAKMLHAGEDIKFIARRLVVLASEDIGNADPMGLVLANAAAQTVMFIGMPEARITLAQTTVYLSAAPNSNAAYLAIDRALNEIKTQGAKPVPPPIADGRSMQGRTSEKGRGYKYPHDFPEHYVSQRYLPEGVTGTPFYEPTELGAEAKIKARMERRRLLDLGEDTPESAEHPTAETKENGEQ